MRRFCGVALMMASFGAIPSVGQSASRHSGPDLMAQGRWGGAMRAAQRAVRAAPSDPAARILLASALLEGGDAGNARKALDEALERGANPRSLLLFKAHAQLLWGDPQGAMETLGEAPLDTSQAAYRARLRLRAHAAMEQWAAVAQDIAEARARNWAGPAFWVDLAKVNMDAGNLAGAYQALDVVLKLAPDYAPAVALGGKLAQRRYGLAASLGWMRHLVALDPDDLRAKLDLAATVGDLGGNREMLALTRAVQRIEPRNARALYFQAVLAARAGQFVLAQSLLERLGDRLRDRPAVLMLKGCVYLQLGLPDRALTDLSHLAAQQPGNLTARRLMARAALQAGDARRALEALSPIVIRSDADGYALMLAARAAAGQGQMADAVALLARVGQGQRVYMAPLAVAPDPSAGPIGSEIQALLPQIAAGNWGAARDRAMAVRNANPGDPEAHLLLGDAEAALQNWTAAAASYQASVNLEASEMALLRLSRALVILGRGGEVPRLWAAFLIQNPQNVTARLLVADAQMSARQWGAAIMGLESLRSRLGDHHVLLMTALSRAWLGMGDAARARIYARAAHIDLPFQANVRAVLARAEMAAGHRSAARRQFRAALADPGLEDREGIARLLKQL